MFGFPALPLQSIFLRRVSHYCRAFPALRKRERLFLLLIVMIGIRFVTPAHAVILWNDPETTLVHENGLGSDILGGALKRDDFANDSLYFKFRVEPRSDKD